MSSREFATIARSRGIAIAATQARWHGIKLAVVQLWLRSISTSN